MYCVVSFCCLVHTCSQTVYVRIYCICSNAGCFRSVVMANCYVIHKYPNRSVQAVLEDQRQTRPAAIPNNGVMTQLYAIEASNM